MLHLYGGAAGATHVLRRWQARKENRVVHAASISARSRSCCLSRGSTSVMSAEFLSSV